MHRATQRRHNYFPTHIEQAEIPVACFLGHDFGCSHEHDVGGCNATPTDGEVCQVGCHGCLRPSARQGRPPGSERRQPAIQYQAQGSSSKFTEVTCKGRADGSHDLMQLLEALEAASLILPLDVMESLQ